MNQQVDRREPRVRLRPPRPGDLDPMWDWESDPQGWSSGSPLFPLSRHDLGIYLDNYSADLLGEGQLRLVAETGGKPAGAVDIFDYDPMNRRAGVGIIIDSALRGRGIGSQALRLLADYSRGHLGLHMLWAQVLVDNEPSLRLFDSCGFTRSAILPQWVLRFDKYTDAVLFTLVL